MNKFHLHHSHQLLVPAAADVREYPPQHPPACRLPSAASLTALRCFALLCLSSRLSTPLKYSRIRRENYLSVVGRNCSFNYLSLTALCPSFLCLLLLLHQSVIEFGNKYFFPCSLKFFLPLAAAWCPESSTFGFEFLTRAACSNSVSSTGLVATELYLHHRQTDSTHLQLVSLHPYWSSAEFNSSLYCETSSYIIIRFISLCGATFQCFIQFSHCQTNHFIFA